MAIITKSIFLLLAACCLINLAKCAPTVIEEDPKTTDICEIEEFLPCEDDDQKCENENEKIRLKKKKICEENPECSFCELIKNDDLVAEPEVAPTLGPQIGDMPAHEIDTDLSSIAEDQPINRNKKELPKLIERNIIIENDNETQFYRGYVEPSSNITTIIRLTNLINNTNIVNMPTTLNNTNINNIHVYGNKSSTSGGKFGLGYNEDGPCCWSMKPRSCKRTTSGSKCQHKRAKVCGKMCKSKIIHPSKKPCNRIPQWLYPQQPVNPFYPPFPPPIFEDDEIFEDLPEDEEIPKTDPGWVVMQEKCKIVSEDGLQIFNCTDDNTEFEHPFARNSVGEKSKRNVRHAGKFAQIPLAQPQPPPFYGYPIYILPMPIYAPQNFAPQQSYMNNYQQQLPFPPLYDDDQDFDEYDIEYKETNPNKIFKQNAIRHAKEHAKEHAKRNPVIIEQDDEL